MSTGTVEVFFFGVRAGRGRVLNKVLYGEAPPGGSTSYTFIHHFWQKRHPFRIPSSEKWYPFHIPILEHCIPFNCWKCTVLKIWSTKPERFLDFFHNHKMRLLSLFADWNTLSYTQSAEIPTLSRRSQWRGGFDGWQHSSQILAQKVRDHPSPVRQKNMCQTRTFLGEGGSGARDMAWTSLWNLGAKFSETSFRHLKTYFTQISWFKNVKRLIPII